MTSSEIARCRLRMRAWAESAPGSVRCIVMSPSLVTTEHGLTLDHSPPHFGGDSWSTVWGKICPRLGIYLLPRRGDSLHHTQLTSSHRTVFVLPGMWLQSMAEPCHQLTQEADTAERAPRCTRGGRDPLLRAPSSRHRGRAPVVDTGCRAKEQGFRGESESTARPRQRQSLASVSLQWGCRPHCR